MWVKGCCSGYMRSVCWLQVSAAVRGGCSRPGCGLPRGRGPEAPQLAAEARRTRSQPGQQGNPQHHHHPGTQGIHTTTHHSILPTVAPRHSRYTLQIHIYPSILPSTLPYHQSTRGTDCIQYVHSSIHPSTLLYHPQIIHPSLHSPRHTYNIYPTVY